MAVYPKLNFGGAGTSFFSSVVVVGGFTPNAEPVFVSGPSAPLNDELVITGAVVGFVAAPKLNFKGPDGGAAVEAEDDEAACGAVAGLLKNEGTPEGFAKLKGDDDAGFSGSTGAPPTLESKEEGAPVFCSGCAKKGGLVWLAGIVGCWNENVLGASAC